MSNGVEFELTANMFKEVVVDVLKDLVDEIVMSRPRAFNDARLDPITPVDIYRVLYRLKDKYHA